MHRTVLFVFWMLLGTCARAQQAPNVVVLLADDLGYGDLSCFGSQSIETPHIDALARDGMRFTQFYAASAVCSPSRAALLTGRYPLRYGITGHFTDNQEHLPTTTRTLAGVLREAGYRTVHIGKWHLGGLRPRDYEARTAGRAANPGPLQHGFDHALTSIEGAPVRPRLIAERQLYRRGGKYMVRNDRRAPETDRHWTEIKVDEAVEQIKVAREEGKPFFLNLWFDVPHTPYEPAPEPHLSRYAALGVAGDQLYFRSMVSHLDANIGRLIDHLKDSGEYENTLIVFTSDNGPAFQGNPGPFRGGKTDLHEGGIRVPFIAVWPGRIPEGSRSFFALHMIDLLPTIAAAVGTEVSAPYPLDGGNHLPRLLDTAYVSRPDTLLWQMQLYRGFQNQGPKPEPYATAVAHHRGWKLLADQRGPTELFNLRADFRELYNLLDQQPGRAAEMYRRLQQFLTEPRDTSGFVQIE
jgi:N-acetylgalactosamine-6-sulfatase